MSFFCSPPEQAARRATETSAKPVWRRRGNAAIEEDVIFKSRTVKSPVGAAIPAIVAARKTAFRKCDNLRPKTKILVRFEMTYTSNAPGVRGDAFENPPAGGF
ncbi:MULTISPECIES: hypothetical protein [Novosphingobium]|uniref:hypothetical protein n=1 Tax=Novosphingobium sp. TCA1 TaxID=2682474 RepID=UPI0010556E3D|nr:MULTISPECIES: hypothetical protein [Novosphingobium]